MSKIQSDTEHLILNADGSGKEVRFQNNGTQNVVIDSSGNVGIGTSSPSAVGSRITTNIKGSAGAALRLSDDTANLYLDYTDTTGGRLFVNAAEPMVFGTTSTERMRIDSSGNLFVGTTDFDVTINNGEGTVILETGSIRTSRGNGTSHFNRGSNGSLILFKQSGSDSGYISTYSNDLVIGTGDTGIKFDDGANAIYAVNATSGATQDGNRNLGTSSGRWKDLYLSGGVYVGGTTSANYLDDYEEGTWTPTAPSGWSISYDYAHYTKIGRMINLKCKIFITGESTGNLVISGLPFTSGSTNHGSAGQTFIKNLQAVNYTQYTTYISGNVDYFNIYGNGTTSNWTQLTSSDTTTSTELYINATYNTS